MPLNLKTTNFPGGFSTRTDRLFVGKDINQSDSHGKRQTARASEDLSGVAAIVAGIPINVIRSANNEQGDFAVSSAFANTNAWLITDPTYILQGNDEVASVAQGQFGAYYLRGSNAQIVMPDNASVLATVPISTVVSWDYTNRELIPTTGSDERLEIIRIDQEGRRPFWNVTDLRWEWAIGPVAICVLN